MSHYHTLKPYWQQKRRKLRTKGFGKSMKVLKWKDKKVGWHYGKTFLTYRGDWQIMNKFKSFGISLEVLEILRKMDIKTIVIKYKGLLGSFKLITSLDDWLDSNIEYTDEGSDLQKHVKINYMSKVED